MTQFAHLKAASTLNFSEMDPGMLTQRNGTQISHLKSKLRLLLTKVQEPSMKTLRLPLQMKRLLLQMLWRKLLSDQGETSSGTQINQNGTDDE
jgi:hypothetical protein